MLRRPGFIIVTALVLFCFAASFAMAGDAKKKVIVYTGMPKTLTFFINLAKGVEDGCKKHGYEFLDLTPPEMEVEMQIHALDNSLFQLLLAATGCAQ